MGLVSSETSPVLLGDLAVPGVPVGERLGLASQTAGQSPSLGRSWSKTCPGMGEAGSLTGAGTRQPGAVEQGAPGSGAVAGGAAGAPGMWGRGVVGILGLVLQRSGRTVGFALRIPSGRQDTGSVGWWKRTVC